MTGGGARNLPGFIDVGWSEGQGDYFVAIRNTARAIRLSHHKATGATARIAMTNRAAFILCTVFQSHAVSGSLLRRQFDVVEAHRISAAAGVMPDHRELEGIIAGRGNVTLPRSNSWNTPLALALYSSSVGPTLVPLTES